MVQNAASDVEVVKKVKFWPLRVPCDWNLVDASVSHLKPETLHPLPRRNFLTLWWKRRAYPKRTAMR